MPERGPHDDVPNWQMGAIMAATAVIVLGIWLGYHVLFGRLAGAETLW